MAKPRTQARVTIAKDGPYLVSGAVPLALQTIAVDADGNSQGWREGRTVEAQEGHAQSYALCRCGHSRKKPFCDGSHVKVRFDGTETASREPFLKQAKFVEGPRPGPGRRREPVRLRPLLRSQRQRLGPGAANRRCRDSRDLPPPGRELPLRPAGRDRQEDGNRGGTAPAGLDRSRGGSAGALQRTALSHGRHRRDRGGRLRLRGAQPRHALPLRPVGQQAVLQRRPRLGQVPRWPEGLDAQNGTPSSRPIFPDA